MNDFVRTHLHGVFAHLFSVHTLWYLGLVTAVLAMECAMLGYSRSSIRRLIGLDVGTRNDVAMELLHATGLVRPIAMALVFALPYWLAHHTNGLLEVKLVNSIHSPTLAYLAWFVLGDFLDYWAHRWSHALVPWWQVHKYHHSATDFNVITGTRHHVLDHALIELVKTVPLLMMGAPPVWFASAWALRVVIDLSQHSMVDLDYGWFGRWVVVSPVGHRIHHSAEREHWDCNYGNILVIWDRLFGTWYAGERVNAEVGVTDNIYAGGSPLANHVLGMRMFFRHVALGVATGRWRPAASAEDDVASAARFAT